MEQAAADQADALAALLRKEQNADKAGEPAAAKVTDEAGHTHEHPETCPRCALDLTKPYKVTPTEEDLTNFLRAMMNSHTGDRFVKSYPIFGGRVRVTFRSLLAEESENIGEELRRLAGLSGGDFRLLFVFATKLGMAMSMERLETIDANGIVTNQRVFQPVTEELYPVIQGSDEKLCSRAHKKIFTKPGIGEGLYTAISRIYGKFDWLYQHMVTRSEDPNFWKATPPDA